MKGFLFCTNDFSLTLALSRWERGHKKEAQMKSVIRINYIFWKEGPLLPRLLGSNVEC
jgi:hypothetical protein